MAWARCAISQTACPHHGACWCQQLLGWHEPCQHMWGSTIASGLAWPSTARRRHILRVLHTKECCYFATGVCSHKACAHCGELSDFFPCWGCCLWFMLLHLCNDFNTGLTVSKHFAVHHTTCTHINPSTCFKAWLTCTLVSPCPKDFSQNVGHQASWSRDI